MADDTPGSRAKAWFERARGSLSRAGSQGVAGLRKTTDRVSEALGTAAEKLAESETGERLKGVLDTQRVIKKALDAQARGNAAMAYRLLEAEHAARPDDEKLALAFWNVAAATEQAPQAAPGVLRVLRSRAARGELESAASLWMELVAALPDVRFDAGSLVRIVPALAEIDAEKAVVALRQALDPATSGLTAGLAARVAELAGTLDPPSAAVAARIALDSPDIAPTKRERLEALASAPPPAAEPEAPEPGDTHGAEAQAEAAPAPEPAPVRQAPVVPDTPTPEEIDAIAAEFSELVIEEEPPAPVSRVPRFEGLRVVDASPLGLTEEGLNLVVEGGRKATLAYDKILAIAVGEVTAGDDPGIRIDLALNWTDEAGGDLRVVRLRGDRFHPEDLVSEIPGPETLRGFLAQLLAQSDAQALPDVDGAMGDPLHLFDDEASYRREVLQVGAGTG